MTSGPPRRPQISITPLAPSTPSRGRLHWVVVAVWSAALILLALSVIGALLHRSAVSRHLALAAYGDHPGTKFDDALRAANISLGLGAALGLLTFGCAGVAGYRLVRFRPAWRGWLVTATVSIVLLGAGMYLIITSSGSQMRAAGFPPALQWATVEAAVVGVIGTVVAFFVRE